MLGRFVEGARLAADDVHLLPPDLAQTIERETGARIVKVAPRGGGGASRRGAVIALQAQEGEHAAYLSFDTRVADPKRAGFFERETAILRRLGGRHGSGIRVPKLIAAAPAHLGLVTELVEGADRFAAAADPCAVAADYVGQIALLHGIDVTREPLAGFGDPREPFSTRVRRRIADLRAENLAAAPDPIFILALNWLDENIPPDRGASVIVHGDAGAGNFLHDGRRVTALLDWELCHYGDPMEDLAGMWVRSMIQPFRPMREVFAAYEAAGGAPVDLDRVRYFRLYFQLGFTVSGHAAIYGVSGVRPAMFGMSMVFHTLHMNAIARSLGEFMDIEENPIDLPHAPADHMDHAYAAALEDIQIGLLPRLADQEAQAKAKSLARLIKWQRARARWGGAFERAELGEIGAALGDQYSEILSARAALARAILERRVDVASALGLCRSRMARETHLMGEAMGALKNAYFPPLDEAAR